MRLQDSFTSNLFYLQCSFLCSSMALLPEKMLFSRTAERRKWNEYAYYQKYHCWMRSFSYRQQTVTLSQISYFNSTFCVDHSIGIQLLSNGIGRSPPVSNMVAFVHTNKFSRHWRLNLLFIHKGHKVLNTMPLSNHSYGVPQSLARRLLIS